MLVAVRLATNYEKNSRRGTATILLSKHFSCIAIETTNIVYGTNKFKILIVQTKHRWAFFDGHCVSYTPDTCAVSQNSWTSKQSCLESKITKQIFK